MLINKDLLKKLSKKIAYCRKVDKCIKEKFPLENEGLKTINLKEATKLINDLDNDICCKCKCKMEFNYLPFCHYQFSLDTIDDNKIHSVDNIRIVCWPCTSRYAHESDVGVKPKCTRGCHS